MSYEVNSQKEIRLAQWQQIESRVREMKDGLGLGVDEGIIEAVVAFQVCGFPTSQSCEGHVREREDDEQHGLQYPWIEVYSQEPDGWRDNREVQETWRVENLKLQSRMLLLLDEFYQDRQITMDRRLSFRNIGMYGGFRVQSLGGDIMELLELEEQQIKHAEYKAEMDAFTQFLKNKYIH